MDFIPLRHGLFTMRFVKTIPKITGKVGFHRQKDHAGGILPCKPAMVSRFYKERKPPKEQPS